MNPEIPTNPGEENFQSRESEELQQGLEQIRQEVEVKNQKIERVRGGLVERFGKYEIWGEIEGLLSNLQNGALNETDFVSKLNELNNNLEIEENIKELNRGTIREISKTLELGQEKAA